LAHCSALAAVVITVLVARLEVLTGEVGCMPCCNEAPGIGAAACVDRGCGGKRTWWLEKLVAASETSSDVTLAA